MGALGFADHGQRNGEDQAEDHHLQHGVVGHRLGDVLREDVQDGFFRAELADGTLGSLAGVGGQLNSNARLCVRLIAAKPRKIAMVVTISK